MRGLWRRLHLERLLCHRRPALLHEGPLSLALHARMRADRRAARLVVRIRRRARTLSTHTRELEHSRLILDNDDMMTSSVPHTTLLALTSLRRSSPHT